MTDIRIPFHRELRRLVDDQIHEEARAILEGKSTAFDDYRYRVGRLKAYHEVMALAEALEKRMNGDR